jgi:hypothetical protein
MKKYILLGLLTAFCWKGYAQVLINLNLPPEGLTLKSQLWNLSIVNTAGQDIQVQIEISMINASNNQQVLTATTRVMDVPKGLKVLHASEVAPVNYNNMSPGMNVDGGQEGFLPVGTFQLCYSVIRIDREVSEKVAEECETAVIQPVSPPQLVNPTDSEGIELPRPFFNWIPPSPYQLFTGLVYDFNLVEVQPLQTGAEAVQQNIPLETQSNLTATNLQYPLSLPELDTGRLYAWQITARSAGSEVARSDVWTFRVKKHSPDSTRRPSLNYSRLKRESDASYTICSGTLYYEYLNELNDRSVPFSIYDISDASRRQLALDSSLVVLHFGQNLGVMDFTVDNTLKDKRMYLLEFINSKNEHWYLKFQFRKPH